MFFSLVDLYPIFTMSSLMNLDLTDNDIPDDLPDLCDIDIGYDSMVDSVYEKFEMKYLVLPPGHTQMKELQKKMMSYIFDISTLFDGEVDFSTAGVVFLKFPPLGLKPENTYNFYFEGGFLRVNNQYNNHQRVAMLTIEECKIGEDIDEKIIDFIKSIPLQSPTSSMSEDQLAEFSNPF